jgi:transcriptional regulator with XRE-family HTH domain
MDRQVSIRLRFVLGSRIVTSTHDSADGLYATVRAKSRLDALMLEAALGNDDLAKRTRFSESQISRWRNGLRPRPENQRRIAAELGTKLAREIKPEEVWG